MYVPLSTYRLQLHAGFTLDDAADLAPYLAGLGADTCYTSPYFTANPGSMHGYDVCDHNAINPELGGPEAHARFVARLAGLGLGHMVDFVPNHMGVGTSTNAWWRDVLENGPGSPGARYFDVDWAPIKAALKAKLLLPILGDQYGRVLERGELRLEFGDGVLVVKYFDYVLPTNPRLAPQVYRRAVGPLTAELGADNAQLHEFQSILTSLQNLPELGGPDHDHGESDTGAIAEERELVKEGARSSPRTSASARRKSPGRVSRAWSPSARPSARRSRPPSARSTATSVGRSPSLRCTSSSKHRPTVSRTGGRLRTRSTTAASST